MCASLQSVVGQVVGHLHAMLGGQPETGEGENVSSVQARLDGQLVVDSRKPLTSKETFSFDGLIAAGVMDDIIEKLLLDYCSLLALSAVSRSLFAFSVTRSEVFEGLRAKVRSDLVRLLGELSNSSINLGSWCEFLKDFYDRVCRCDLMSPFTDDNVRKLVEMLSIWKGGMLLKDIDILEPDSRKRELFVPVSYLSKFLPEKQQSVFWSSVKTHRLRQLNLDFISIANHGNNADVKQSFFEGKIPSGQFNQLKFLSRCAEQECSIIASVVTSQSQSLLKLHFEMEDIFLPRIIQALEQANERSNDGSDGFKKVCSLSVKGFVASCGFGDEWIGEGSIETLGKLFPNLESFRLFRGQQSFVEGMVSLNASEYSVLPSGVLASISKAWGGVNLKSLVLCGCAANLNAEDLDALRHFSSLESLVLVASDFVDMYRGCDPFLGGESSINLPDSLKSLVIIGYCINPSQLQDLCLKLRKLTVCGYQRDLYNDEIISEAVSELAVKGEQALKELCFDTTFYFTVASVRRKTKGFGLKLLPEYDRLKSDTKLKSDALQERLASKEIKVKYVESYEDVFMQYIL